MKRLLEWFCCPGKLISGVMRRFRLGSTPLRVRYDGFAWPHYAYGVFQAAILAKSLNVPRISVAEFGVAGGRGLIALENASIAIERWSGVKIDVWGFDSGCGMPAPVDIRDHMYNWKSGMLVMNKSKLEGYLTRAKLVLGKIFETSTQFLQRTDFGPLGFVSVDVDYYSSTMDVFRIFEGTHATRLPRVYIYMDEVSIPDQEELHYHAFTEFLGERLAIRDFNAAHQAKKISKLHGLANQRPIRSMWSDRIYVLHDFEHPQYNTFITPAQFTELPI